MWNSWYDCVSSSFDRNLLAQRDFFFLLWLVLAHDGCLEKACACYLSFGRIENEFSDFMIQVKEENEKKIVFVFLLLRSLPSLRVMFVLFRVDARTKKGIFVFGFLTHLGGRCQNPPKIRIPVTRKTIRNSDWNRILIFCSYLIFVRLLRDFKDTQISAHKWW